MGADGAGDVFAVMEEGVMDDSSSVILCFEVGEVGGGEPAMELLFEFWEECENSL